MTPPGDSHRRGRVRWRPARAFRHGRTHTTSAPCVLSARPPAAPVRQPRGLKVDQAPPTKISSPGCIRSQSPTDLCACRRALIQLLSAAPRRPAAHRRDTATRHGPADTRHVLANYVCLGCFRLTLHWRRLIDVVDVCDRLNPLHLCGQGSYRGCKLRHICGQASRPPMSGRHHARRALH